MTHALVIGGTGMLANTSLWLVNNGYHVSVIGRNADRMERLLNKANNSSMITPLLVDYRDESLLLKKIRETMQQNGPIELVIAWIHSYADSTLERIASEISQWQGGSWKLFHVLGSRANLTEVKGQIDKLDALQYHQVQLGFKIEDSHSRWLTNEEISQGVIDSIQHDRLLHTVGTMEPWEKRPL
ncbi:short-chain dehydrogenase [Lysinibacillus irui]|uniref:Short-chain dehydrogenase n=1 Tax=Lysinibacillus irui TaxID=2998077 RepID=A0ABU5NHX9_9BACI|nr:short-chain dehydrogenase [Lysinibacillus irui]MEA0553016.1 short-chain dehydrogenase [Lysinibacillus irui]MEA0975596.1 short-chain dehydrogenase [Lysinibacillus irui]MEA1041750.1 short-chain dehydrogenase [Lysinibacillus irui]